MKGPGAAVLMFLVVLAAPLALACCARKAPNHIPVGITMSPPMGAVDYCKRNPKDENCHEQPHT